MIRTSVCRMAMVTFCRRSVARLLSRPVIGLLCYLSCTDITGYEYVAGESQWLGGVLDMLINENFMYHFTPEIFVCG